MPAGWETAVSRSTGDTYYRNTVTEESRFEHPWDESDTDSEHGDEGEWNDYCNKVLSSGVQEAHTRCRCAGVGQVGERPLIGML